jgi:hypothetical protein
MVKGGVLQGVDAGRMLACPSPAADYEIVISSLAGDDLRFPEFIPWSAQCRPPMTPKPGVSANPYRTPPTRKPIMNRITRIAALALSFAAVGSAFAESPGLDTQHLSGSTLTRAEVTAEVLQARAAGTLVATEADLNKGDTVLISRSRDAVRADTLAAIASGEVQALAAEIGRDFVPARRATVLTQMASR